MAGCASSFWRGYIERQVQYGWASDSETPALLFTHGSSISWSGTDGMVFIFQRPVGSEQGSGCVNYGDSVVIAYTSNIGNTQNYGWYGCRVAYTDEESKVLRFGQGAASPEAFFIQPLVGVARSGCVQCGDDVVIAQTPDTGNSQNCGWYGCRVAYMMSLSNSMTGAAAGAMFFHHVGSEPQTFFLRPTPGA